MNNYNYLRITDKDDVKKLIAYYCRRLSEKLQTLSDMLVKKYAEESDTTEFDTMMKDASKGYDSIMADVKSGRLFYSFEMLELIGMGLIMPNGDYKLYHECSLEDLIEYRFDKLRKLSNIYNIIDDIGSVEEVEEELCELIKDNVWNITDYYIKDNKLYKRIMPVDDFPFSLPTIYNNSEISYDEDNNLSDGWTDSDDLINFLKRYNLFDFAPNNQPYYIHPETDERVYGFTDGLYDCIQDTYLKYENKGLDLLVKMYYFPHFEDPSHELTIINEK